MRNMVFILVLLPLMNAFAKELTATEVNIYKQAALSGIKQKGDCFSNAVSVVRPDAWRCNINGSISDPCFQTKNAKVLVCDVNPLKNKPGFLLQLTKSLPKAEKVKAPEVNVWMLQLEDGTVCTPFTGTMPLIHEGDQIKAVKYGCESSTKAMVGLLDDSVKKGKLWQAQKIVYTSDNKGLKIDKIQEVKIKAVWQ